MSRPDYSKILLLSVLSCLVCLAGIGFSKQIAKAQAVSIIQVDVRVVDGKPGGQLRAPSSLGWETPYLWDVSFLDPDEVEPDIAIYIEETDETYPCVSPVTGYALEDTLACAFLGVETYSDSVSLIIGDYDLFEHDLIGRGVCAVGQTCRIGQAEVTLTAVPCDDREIQVRYPSDTEFIEAYKGLWIFDGLASQLISS